MKYLHEQSKAKSARPNVPQRRKRRKSRFHAWLKFFLAKYQNLDRLKFNLATFTIIVAVIFAFYSPFRVCNGIKEYLRCRPAMPLLRETSKAIIDFRRENGYFPDFSKVPDITLALTGDNEANRRINASMATKHVTKNDLDRAIRDCWGFMINIRFYENVPYCNYFDLWSNGPNMLNEYGKGDDIFLRATIPKDLVKP